MLQILFIWGTTPVLVLLLFTVISRFFPSLNSKNALSDDQQVLAKYKILDDKAGFRYLLYFFSSLVISSGVEIGLQYLSLLIKSAGVIYSEGIDFFAGYFLVILFFSVILSGKLYFGSVYKIARKISDNEAQFDRLLSHWRAKQAAQTKIDIVKIWKPLSMVFLILFIVISIFGLSYGLRVSPTDFSFQGYAKLTPVAYNYSDVGSIVRITKHTDRAGQEVGNIPYYEIFGRNGKLIFSTVNMSMRNSQKERGVINYFTQKTGISATVQ